ncbi:MAG: hypothetical protein JWP42_2699 [Pseudomonas sp.]|nr:hypothetical protein [Pseudomonas sp.]
MLVSANQILLTPLPKKPGDDPTADAAAGLQGGLQATLMQSVQNNLQLQNLKNEGKVQAGVSQLTTEQVNAANKISDNVDEAFAKTRVALQATDTTTAPKADDSTAMADFKDYMSKTPEQRLRDSILKEMGITEEDLKAMPPEKQLAIGKEIAERLQDKMKLAQAEKENGGSSSAEKGSTQVVDKFLASL